MWGHYRQLRSSEAFRLDWVKFVQESVKRTPSPVFFQYVTHELFKCLIKEEWIVADGKKKWRKQRNDTRGRECTEVCSRLYLP